MLMSKLRGRIAVLAVVGCSAVGANASAQIVIERSEVAEPMLFPGGPMRGPVKIGTGRIAGRVVSAETGAPLRRAQVWIAAPEAGTKTALTDAEGRYEFKDLPAGRFSVNASKSGYVSVQYGQSRPFESGRPIELADKQVLDKADIAMPRGGVISGRILDEFGEPVADAAVSTMRQTWLNGRRRLTATGRIAQTNDLGQFRLYGLPPGEYYVSATLRSAETMMLDLAVGGAIAGGGGSQPTSGYAPTYFPGTPTAASAQRVTVTIGQEAQNTEFALVPVRLARITGSVMSSEGKPVEGAMITATPLNRAGEVGLAMMGATGRTNKEGNFTISSVAPGDYTLNVRSVRVFTTDGGDNMSFRAVIGGGEGSDAETASLPVVVAGEDLANVLIITAKGGTAIGRVTFEGASKPTAVTGIRITAAAADADGPGIGGAAATVKADGSFELKGLSGRRLIRVANLPTGWTLKAIRLNGDDITDGGVEFKGPQGVSGLEIVAIDKTSEISGGVTATNGSPIKDYTVVVFAEDQSLWSLPMTRWVTGTRPDQEGRFRVRNMPAGSYYAVAVDYVEQGSWGDPELLERLKARAKRFTLAEGGTETLDLKLVDQY